MSTLVFFAGILLPFIAQVQAPLVPAQPTPAPVVQPAVVQPVPDVAPVESVLVRNAPFGNHTKRGILPDDLPDGIYILKVSGGVKTLESAEELVLNVPTPPGPNPPGPLTDFGKAIKAAADKATGDKDRANTAQGLAMLYRTISAEAHKAGTTATLESVSNTTLYVTDKALTNQGPAAVAAWGETRALLRAALVDSVQFGKTVPQMGDLLDQAADGLEASAPKATAQAPSPAFWEFLFKLLQELLPLLLNLKK